MVAAVLQIQQLPSQTFLTGCALKLSRCLVAQQKSCSKQNSKLTRQLVKALLTQTASPFMTLRAPSRLRRMPATLVHTLRGSAPCSNKFRQTLQTFGCPVNTTKLRALLARLVWVACSLPNRLLAMVTLASNLAWRVRTTPIK